MPFKSEAQRRFMYAKHPEMAKRWQKHTPKGAKLPERVSEGFQRWETPDIRGMLAKHEDAAPGMAGANIAGVTTAVNTGPYQVPIGRGKLLRRVVPGFGKKRPSSLK